MSILYIFKFNRKGKNHRTFMITDIVKKDPVGFYRNKYKRGGMTYDDLELITSLELSSYTEVVMIYKAFKKRRELLIQAVPFLLNGGNWEDFMHDVRLIGTGNKKKEDYTFFETY